MPRDKQKVLRDWVYRYEYWLENGPKIIQTMTGCEIQDLWRDGSCKWTPAHPDNEWTGVKKRKNGRFGIICEPDLKTETGRLLQQKWNDAEIPDITAHRMVELLFDVEFTNHEQVKNIDMEAFDIHTDTIDGELIIPAISGISKEIMDNAGYEIVEVTFKNFEPIPLTEGEESEKDESDTQADK